MSKALYITEKPSVAMEFAKVLKIKGQRRNGYLEAEEAVVTWCVGHLVTMSYPDAYDEALKKWSLKTLPFLPKEYKYEVIPTVKNQFDVIQQLLHRSDITSVYVCTDSGREGEYIYRLVDLMVGVEGKDKKRVWIDSQTEEEILRGIKEAKPLSEYDPLSDSAFLRAKEDYLAGINFSRLLTLIFGKVIAKKLQKEHVVVAVGRVMTCVLGMIVDREIEVRKFVKTPFYKINGTFGKTESDEYMGEWKAVEASRYHMSPMLFNDNGFKEKRDAEKLIEDLMGNETPVKAQIDSVKKSKEKKYAPLLYNLAELQAECSKKFKINPDETLTAVQTLYEKKLVTYPRTDARVLSTAVAKEINNHLKGLMEFRGNTNIKDGAAKVLQNQWIKNIKSSKYVNDDKITDHYAIIPTGKGFENYNRLKELDKKIYKLITLRFLAIFYPPAVFQKLAIVTAVKGELFQTNQKVCVEQGYLEILKPDLDDKDKGGEENQFLNSLRKGQQVELKSLEIKEGETTPPKRYTSGSIILAMENAGKLIEDEELREQIKGSGIGTSATRAEIIKKLMRIEYIDCHDKTQVLTPTSLGELIYLVVKKSIPDLLNPKLTASWEKGLEMVAKKELQKDEYMEKLEKYITRKVSKVLNKAK
ncbi:DNA topoisomerase [Alkaliphilus hydrothermalis]|uniref:DNA topoisomerase n=1 Tax=Alkaliphilus hydrothermalis TaxID=1482730 RepID=A0ABS2NSK1_9FIRM|nr:DNA topoisomerase [Alkaliphilus hydrothermalis]MBM7615937.1 DNA topoisomerase-3 [Alkaliphilus hydrothermalis]